MADDSVLVIAAHPDDECLGAGGTIRRHVDQGIPVDVLCLTGNKTRNKELKAACGVLGTRNLYLSERDDFIDDSWSLTQEVIGGILKSRPRIIITHSKEDYNRNHIACADIVTQAVEWASHVTLFDDAHRVECIYNMEVNSLISRPHVFMDISKTYEAAMSALKHHESQTGKADDFYLKFFNVVAQPVTDKNGCLFIDFRQNDQKLLPTIPSYCVVFPCAANHSPHNLL